MSQLNSRQQIVWDFLFHSSGLSLRSSTGDYWYPNKSPLSFKLPRVPGSHSMSINFRTQCIDFQHFPLAESVELHAPEGSSNFRCSMWVSEIATSFEKKSCLMTTSIDPQKNHREPQRAQVLKSIDFPFTMGSKTGASLVGRCSCEVNYNVISMILRCFFALHRFSNTTGNT